MSEEDLIKRLTVLAERAAANRSATERLRRVISSVQLALDSGASQREVLAQLNHGIDGFGMTLASFKSALLRIRKELGELNEDSKRSSKITKEKKNIRQLVEAIKSAREAAGLPPDSDLENPKNLLDGLGALFAAGAAAKEKAKRDAAASAESGVPKRPGSLPSSDL